MRARCMWWSIAFVCGCRSAPPSVLQPARTPAGVTLELLRVDAGNVVGISGLAIDARQRLWVVAERQRSLLRLQREGDALKAQSPVVSMIGLPAGVETEALGWLDDNRFVLGTESDVARAADALIVIRVEGARATVERTYSLNYAWLGMRAANNAGIEAACALDDRVLVGIEQRSSRGEAALAVLNLRDGRWQALRLRLSSGSGKISSFDCDVGADGAIEVLAIERHYDVARVLSFQVLAHAPAAVLIVPSVLIDLEGVLEPLPNFESIGRVGNDIVLINDNHHGSATGPTQALWIGGLLPLRRDQKR